MFFSYSFVICLRIPCDCNRCTSGPAGLISVSASQNDHISMDIKCRGTSRGWLFPISLCASVSGPRGTIPFVCIYIELNCKKAKPNKKFKDEMNELISFQECCSSVIDHTASTAFPPFRSAYLFEGKGKRVTNICLSCLVFILFLSV